MPIYEVIDGDALEAIEAHCRHMATVNGFSATTHPTLDEVRRFIDMAYYKIAGMLANVGYSIVQTNADVLGWLQNLQVLETVIQIEMTKPTSGAGQPSARFREFVNQRDMLLQLLLTDSGILSGMGATKTLELGAYTEVTGTSKSRKDDVKSDPDLVPFRFNRGFAEYPGTPSAVVWQEEDFPSA